jgi:hypothetical protein
MAMAQLAKTSGTRELEFAEGNIIDHNWTKSPSGTVGEFCAMVSSCIAPRTKSVVIPCSISGGVLRLRNSRDNASRNGTGLDSRSPSLQRDFLSSVLIFASSNGVNRIETSDQWLKEHLDTYREEHPEIAIVLRDGRPKRHTVMEGSPCSLSSPSDSPAQTSALDLAEHRTQA